MLMLITMMTIRKMASLSTRRAGLHVLEISE